MKAKMRILFFILISLYERAENKSIGIVDRNSPKNYGSKRLGCKLTAFAWNLSS